MAVPARARITAIHPLWAVEGGRVTVSGSDFPIQSSQLPDVRIGPLEGRVVFASSTALAIVVPPGLEGGRIPVRVEGVSGETAFLEVARTVTTGIHQVDSPVFDRDGTLYVTYSGTRGQQTPVSIFRVRPDGVRETFVTEILNPTSMAIDRRGRLYVSSRFEGNVYRVDHRGRAELFASELGIPCGLAFGPGGELYVGDRSGSIFRVSQLGEVALFATLPPSVAAFHLTFGPDGRLYVAGPTLSSYDSLYRIDADGTVEALYNDFGRPQGLIFDAQGALYVVEALAGKSGVYRLRPNVRDTVPELVVSGPSLVGVAIPPEGGLVVSSNDTVYRLDVNVHPPQQPAG